MFLTNIDNINYFFALEMFFLANLPEVQVPTNKEQYNQNAIDWFEFGQWMI